MNAVPHILVADAVLRHLGWTESSRAHMAVGAVAPDTYRIMPGEGFRGLHFRGGRRPGEMLRDFADTYVVPALARERSDEQAFWAGWYCHLVSDQIWRRTLMKELPGLWKTITSSHSDERARLRDEYQAACNRVDLQLVETPGSQVPELRWLLRAWSPSYEVGPLGPSVLREWVLQVASSAMPPPEPALAGAGEIDSAFVTRAMQTAQQQLYSDMGVLVRRAFASPEHEDPFEEV